jgi:hypothetical protein
MISKRIILPVLLIGLFTLSACQPKFIPDSWKEAIEEEFTYEEYDYELEEKAEVEMVAEDTSTFPHNPDLCCDTIGNCYDEDNNVYEDSRYQKYNFCDNCGNCYDYYGNYVEYRTELFNMDTCFNSDLEESVRSWDQCGNAFDENGSFLFYENRNYNWQSCNNDYRKCLGY